MLSLQRVDIKYNKYSQEGYTVRWIAVCLQTVWSFMNYSIYNARFYVYQQQQYDNTALLRSKNEIELNHILVFQILPHDYTDKRVEEELHNLQKFNQLFKHAQ